MSGARVGGAAAALRRLRWADLREAGRAQTALLRAYLRVRGRPIGALVAAQPLAPGATSQAGVGGVAGGRPTLSAADRAARRAVIQRLELAVARAARRGLFRPTCLVRSLALADLLADRGVAGAEIRIGVRQPDSDGGATSGTRAQLEAHAWVELDGMVVGDDPRRAQRFTPLGGVRAVEPPAGGSR